MLVTGHCGCLLFGMNAFNGLTESSICVLFWPTYWVRRPTGPATSWHVNCYVHVHMLYWPTVTVNHAGNIPKQDIWQHNSLSESRKLWSGSDCFNTKKHVGVTVMSLQRCKLPNRDIPKFRLFCEWPGQNCSQERISTKCVHRYKKKCPGVLFET